jgi:hypothetical protein
MEENTLVKLRFSATINAPMERVDIPSSCSPAHCSGGAITTPDGPCESIVEILGGRLMVEHYIEEVGESDHLRLVSNSDVFTPTGARNTEFRGKSAG